MINCYPDKIKKLPQFNDFWEEMKFIDKMHQKMGLSLRNANKLKKRVEQYYGIKRVPKECGSKCPYYKICQEETKEIRRMLKTFWKRVVEN